MPPMLKISRMPMVGRMAGRSMLRILRQMLAPSMVAAS